MLSDCWNGGVSELGGRNAVFFFKLIWNLKQDKVTQNVSGTKFCKYSRLKHMLLYLALASLETKVQRPW